MGQSNNKQFLFLGVSTAKSAVNALFHDWLNVINTEADLIGIDIPVDANSKEYQPAIDLMMSNSFAGALITSHKARMYELLRDRIKCTQSAIKLCEISAVYKKNNILIGDALDPISINIILRRLLKHSGWQNNSNEVYIFGGGGAAIALIYSLAVNDYNVSKIHISEQNRGRLDFIEDLLMNNAPYNTLDISVYSSGLNDELLQKAPPGSLITNASGVGKDRGGSLFQSCEYVPYDSIVWEFNYRGHNLLSDEVMPWKVEKRLLIEDGWIYFINGWAQHLGHAFDAEMTASIMNKFIQIASSIR